MRQLMLSLDKKILDSTSAVAKRMIEYGKNNDLYIIVPDKVYREVELSPHVHVYASGGFGKLWQWNAVFKVAERLIKQGLIEEITTQDPQFLGLSALRLKRKYHLPLEVQLHGDFFSTYAAKGLQEAVRGAITLYMIRVADRVRVVGERVKQMVAKMSVLPEKIIVRPIAIDVERIANCAPRLRLHDKYPGHSKIFLVLGRLDPIKNISWLLDVFAEVVKQKSDYLLVIVGDGEQKSLLSKKIQSLRLVQNVIMEGWTDDPVSYEKTTDALLFPSLSEGYGLVAMEAHAAGTPIIMSDVGVANYELKPSEKVTILPINDKQRWLEAILAI